MAPTAPQAAPTPCFVQHPVDGDLILRAELPRLAPAPDTRAYKHPGRMLELACVLIV